MYIFKSHNMYLRNLVQYVVLIIHSFTLLTLNFTRDTRLTSLNIHYQIISLNILIKYLQKLKFGNGL